jgi:membrane peptidoglycan carboxypeptidase
MRPRIVRALIPAQGGRPPLAPGDPSSPVQADAGASASGLPDPGDGAGKGAGAPESRRVISEATARSLRAILQTVTTDGTGKAAAIPGYTVGGKTGTAQKIDRSGHYSRGHYVSWFAGFVPAGRPALAIVVMVDEPKGAKTHGGDVAAPVFARIARPTLMYLKVPPDHEDPLVFDRSLQASLSTGGAAAPPGGMARTTGIDRSYAAAIAVRTMRRDRGTALRAAQDRGPAAAVHASLGALSETPDRDVALMPDLSGMSLRQANESLAARGLVCRNDVKGERVTRQDPDPGTPVTPATPCVVMY